MRQSMAKNIKLAFVLLLGTFLILGCGGGGSSGGGEQKKENSTTFVDNAILLDADKSAKIINSKVSSDQTQLQISNDAMANVEVGKIFVLPAGNDKRFPFGVSGKVESITDATQDSKTVSLSEVRLADVVKQLHIAETTVALTAENFIGVIAPSAVGPTSDALAASKNSRALSANEKSFLDGGVVFRTAEKNASKDSRVSFLGGNGQISLGKIDLSLEVDLSKMSSNPDAFQAINHKKKSSLVVKGGLDNLKVTQSHDYDIVSTSPYVAFKAVVEGDLNATAAFEGSHKLVLGAFNNAWKETEESSGKLLGVKLTLAGLKSDDKEGKYPIAGLVFKSPAPVVVSNESRAIDLAKSYGLIIWVYINAKGELSLDGSIGVGTHTSFKFEIDKPKDKELVINNEINKSSAGRLLEAPFIEGSASLKANLGLAIEADIFLVNMRLVNAGIELGMEGKYTIGVDKRWSYGFDKITEPWSWNHNDVECKLDFGAGVKMDAKVNLGWEMTKGSAKSQLNYEPLHIEYPKKSDIDQATSGWIGTWYKSETINDCGLRATLLGISNSIYGQRAPVLSEAELNTTAVKYYNQAYLADRVYADSISIIGITKNGWKLVDMDYQGNGFKGALYQKSDTGKYAIVFGGTSATIEEFPAQAKAMDFIIDAITDLQLFSNHFYKANQAKSAMDFLTKPSVASAIASNNVSFITGHSLGGGLAQYIGAYTGIDTVTFNTAPMSFTNESIEPFLNNHALGISGKTQDGAVTNFTFKHSDKITNLISHYDYVSVLSELLEKIDKGGGVGEVAIYPIKAITLNSPLLELDYLITGKTVYMPIYGNTFGQHHSMSMIVDKFAQYLPSDANLTIDTKVVGRTLTVTLNNIPKEITQFQIYYGNNTQSTFSLTGFNGHQDNYTETYTYDKDGVYAVVITVGDTKKNVSITAAQISNKTSKIPKTGQTTIYTNFDDGYYQKGSAVTPRYTRDAAKETVSDHVTGLMWQDDAAAKTVTKPWAEAITYCENLTLGGFTDWRLPSIEELFCITDKGRINPSIDPTFENVVSGNCWSSTTPASDASLAWGVFFYYGSDIWHSKGTSYYVRCMRDGQ